MLNINWEVLKKEYWKYEDIAEEYVESDGLTEEGERDYDIYMALNDLITYYPLVGLICDKQTFREFTRRSERAIEDLKKTGYDITKIEA